MEHCGSIPSLCERWAEKIHIQGQERLEKDLAKGRVKSTGAKGCSSHTLSTWQQ